MSNHSLTALEIINKEFPKQNPFTTREKVGNLNQNIVFEIRKDNQDPDRKELLVVEYKPQTKETVHLRGHGFNKATQEDINLRLQKLKEAYEHLAYEIGDKVLINSTNYRGITGEVVDVKRAYLEMENNGLDFAPDGLLTMEDTIKSIALDYEFDGYTLKVKHPEHDYGSWIQKAYTRVAILHGYVYTVKIATKDLPQKWFTDSLLVTLSPSSLKKVNN